MISGAFTPPPNEPKEKEGFSLHPALPQHLERNELKWTGKKGETLEAYRRAHADFFELWKRVIGFDRQWDCCDCGRNIYSGTTQHASKTITVYYSYSSHPCISHWPAGVYWLVVIVLHTNFHTGSGGFYFTGKNGKTTKQTFPCSGETIYFKTEALIHPEIDAFRLRCVQVLVLSWSVLALFFRLWPRVGFHTGAPSENCGGTSDLLCSDWETQRLCV